MDHEGTKHLPGVNEEGPADFIMSLGWCGGHGEAVLDEQQQILRIEDLPLYVDSESEERISSRLDLSGSFEGTPVVRVIGSARIERRKARNRSIPRAPKQRYLALVLTTLTEAHLIATRAD